MITNKSLTVYHKGIDTETRLENWTRFNYNQVWFFDSKSANVNKGYENNDNVEIRIPFGKNSGLNISNFSIGDIVVEGTLSSDIETDTDLIGNNYYYITSLKNNNFGKSPHIHIGGK